MSLFLIHNVAEKLLAMNIINNAILNLTKSHERYVVKSHKMKAIYIFNLTT